MKYKASTDILSKILTLLVFLFFAWLSISAVKELLNSYETEKSILEYLAGPIILGLILLATFLISTRGYFLDATEFRIQKPLFTRRIRVTDIESVRLMSGKEMRGSIRTFGSGGLFGYFGKFYNSRLGSMTWYVTQGKNRTLITTIRGEKIVISPDDPRLAEKLQSVIST